MLFLLACPVSGRVFKAKQMKTTFKIMSLLLLMINIQSWAQSSTNNSHINKLEKKAITEKDSLEKKLLTPEDYKLWSTMHSNNIFISSDARWYSYKLNYENNIDTMFVAAVKNDRKFSFPSGSNSQFSNDGNWFSCIVPDKGLAILNLKNGNLQWVLGIERFNFSNNNQFLIGVRKSMDSDTKNSSLWVMDLEQGKHEMIPGVSEYLLNPTNSNIVYIVDSKVKKAVVVRTLEKYPDSRTIIENDSNSYKKLIWSSKGAALVFLEELPSKEEEQKNYKIIYYTNKGGKTKIKSLNPSLDSDTLKGMHITQTFWLDAVRIADDEAAIYFKVQSQEEPEKITDNDSEVLVQVWKARDKIIYPMQKFTMYNPITLAVWWPEKNKTMLLETHDLPSAALLGDQKQFLSYNPLKNAPHFSNSPKIDFYLTDMETGESNLFLKNQVNNESNMVNSSSGKYISYFKDKDWWVYDLKKKTHTNLTKNIKVGFYQREEDNAHSGELIAYGSPGWTEQDREFIVYDKYDIWLLSPNGTAPQKLTHGRQNQIQYRIYKPTSQAFKINSSNNENYRFEQSTLKLSEGVLIKSLGEDMASGFSLWKRGKELKHLVYKDMYVSNMQKVHNKDAFIYLEQSFSTPPRLRYWEKGMSDHRIILETNLQQKQFQWGYSELIHYKGPDGQKLRGALFYPANYKLGEKYPMIVNVYELKSRGVHHYENPSEFLGAGFSHTNYTADGFLVFMPDIWYKFSDPMISALNCIESGVKAVVKKGIVEEEHIGITGHSFGGYETAFIITQTNLFATAIAGSGITDLVSFYHTMNGQYLWPQMNSVESMQFRFNDSFYENPEAYYRNSPINYAANINTPLLLMTGEEDHHVNWQQSVELYLGLRRLDKECEMLIYPGEGHVLLNPKNQVDFTRRMKKWFDKYLKPDKNQAGSNLNKN